MTMESQNNQQGFDEAFVDEPPELYQCVVCLLVLRQPLLLLKCSHRFCSPCMDLFKEHSAKQGNELLCPVDRDPINLNMVCEDHGLRRAIGSLHVKCREWESGCGWVGELTELQHHHDTCRYRTPPNPINSAQEVEDLTSLVRTLQGRLETFERRFKDKEKEMAHFNHRIQEMEEQNALLTKEVKWLKEKEAISAQKLKEMKHEQEEKFRSFERKIFVHDSNNNFRSGELQIRNMLLDNSNNNSRSAELQVQNNQVTKEESFKCQNNNNLRSAELHLQNNQFKKAESTNLQIIHPPKKMLLAQFDGKPKITAGNHVDFPRSFGNCSTVVASDCGVPGDVKGFYEVSLEGGSGYFYVGWVTEAFLTSARRSAVGDCCNSYGYNAVCQRARHDRRYLDWGVEVNRSGGSVIGVAIDTQYGEILYGVNGSWNSPMGVAFLNIKKDIYCPAISGCDFKCSVNCGQGDFKFGPPDPSFKKVIDF